MKSRLSNILAFVILTLFTVSCNKMLDPDPKDVIPDNKFLKDFWDAEFMLRGAYQALQPIVEYRFVLGDARFDSAGD